MNASIKLLHKARRKPLRNAVIRRLVRHHLKTIKSLTGQKMKVKDEGALLSLLIMAQALHNKQALEISFERTRKELADLWDTLDRQERNFLANQKLDVVKRKLTSFKDDSGQTIWIACFDALLNALYDKRISIFELDQYFKLYTSFNDRLIPVEQYGLTPLAQNYIELDVLDVAIGSILIYYRPLHSVMRVDMVERAYRVESVPLAHTFKFKPEDSAFWSRLHTVWRSESAQEVMDCFAEWPALEPRLFKRLARRRKKLI